MTINLTEAGSPTVTIDPHSGKGIKELDELIKTITHGQQDTLFHLIQDGEMGNGTFVQFTGEEITYVTNDSADDSEAYKQMLYGEYPEADWGLSYLDVLAALKTLGHIEVEPKTTYLVQIWW